LPEVVGLYFTNFGETISNNDFDASHYLYIAASTFNFQNNRKVEGGILGSRRVVAGLASPACCRLQQIRNDARSARVIVYLHRRRAPSIFTAFDDKSISFSPSFSLSMCPCMCVSSSVSHPVALSLQQLIHSIVCLCLECGFSLIPKQRNGTGRRGV